MTSKRHSEAAWAPVGLLRHKNKRSCYFWLPNNIFIHTITDIITCCLHIKFHMPRCKQRQSQWPPGLRSKCAAARLLGLWVRIPPWAWMFVCCECCVESGRGLCEELITRPEESYRLWCVVVCDLETSWMRRPWPTGGGGGVCRAKNKTNKKNVSNTNYNWMMFISLNHSWCKSQAEEKITPKERDVTRRTMKRRTINTPHQIFRTVGEDI